LTSLLGTRPIGRLLWQSCSQTTLSVGVYGIYALTNAWFVARGVGPSAMAAVNLVAPVLLVLGAVSTTVGVGGASLVSRSLGAGDTTSAARAAGNAFALFWTTAVAFTVVGLLTLGPLLTVLGDTSGASRPYAVVILAGALVSTGFSSLVRAEGRMRFSTLLWVSAVLAQITLDPVLIFGFRLGVRGAALGIVGGQSISAGLSIWFFFVQRVRPYRIGRSDLVLHGPTVRALLGVGAPSFLAGLGATLLVLLVNKSLGATSALAAYAVCARIQTFVMMPQLGLSQGLQPVVGYNTGRGRSDRVARARTLALRASVLYGLVVATMVVLFAGPLVGFFLDDGPAAALAHHALPIIGLGFAFAGVTPLVSAYCQAVGRAGPSYLISIGTLLLVKAPLVVLLGGSGTTGVWVALALGEFVSAVVALVVVSRLSVTTAPGSSTRPSTVGERRRGRGPTA
jgi:MATE family, multidrug efflux pump